MKNLTQNHYNGSHAVIIVYAIDSIQSIKSVEQLSFDVDQLCDKGVLKFLVGNKCDLDAARVISWDDAKEQAETCEIEQVFETSAMQDKRDTILELFNEIIRELVKKRPNPQPKLSLHR